MVQGYEGARPFGILRAVTVGLYGLSAVWIFVLAMLILADVGGRGLFNQPLMGVHELLRNSIVAIVFLQLPYAVLSGGMIRVELLYDRMGPGLRTTIDALNALVGIGLFSALVYASWNPLLESWAIGEFEGEGTLRVPVYPVRAILIATSVLVVIVYASLLVRTLASRAAKDKNAERSQ